VLSRLVETLGIGTLSIRLSDGRVVDVSQAQAHMLGRSREEVLGQPATEAGIVADGPALERLVAAAPGRVELTMRTRAGVDRAVDVAVERAEVDGDACLTLATRIVDLGDRRVAEQALRASEQRYRGIVESASEGVWMLDELDRISFVNRAMARMLGFEVHELLGRRAVEFLVEESEPVGRRALRSRREGVPQRQEVRMRRKDGSDLWAEMSATPLEEEDGRYVGAVSVVADTTERHRARTERERFRHRLQEAQRLETVGQLAGGVAHDFNNLLAVILNYAYFVREQLPEDSASRADLEEIRHAAERASELTHQLLVFSRRENVRPVVLDVNKVVRDVARLLGRTIGEHVALVTELAPQECLVEADAAQLEQVVLNLVVNARDALPKGGEIRVATSRDGGVTLTVSDEGTGMEPEVAARAFEPFFTTKPKGAGTGLGLATVYGTVTQAGGHAEIDSEPGRGTTVRVHLPAATAPLSVAEPPAVEGHAGAGATVLLVEDEDAVRTLTSRILAGSGFECLEASGGEEALRLYDLNRDRVSLLLTDVVMPGMSGPELAERITVDGSGPPVLFMSGYSDQSEAGAGRAGTGALLQKPFSADSLLRSVRDAMAAPAAAPAPPPERA
jgi:PAS domain S-box-containing protein